MGIMKRLGNMGMMLRRGEGHGCALRNISSVVCVYPSSSSSSLSLSLSLGY